MARIVTDKQVAKRPRPERGEVLPPAWTEPWERQPGEGDQRWEAFVIYRDQPTNGITRRSLEKVAASCGKHHTLIERWSRQDGWRQRVHAWDAHVQSQKDLAFIRRREQIADEHARQLGAVRMALVQPTLALLDRINRARQQGTDALDGIPTSELLKAMVGASRALGPVMQIERLSAGLSTTNADVHVSGDLGAVEARRQAEQMPPLERDRLLLGDGVDDGRGGEREAAEARAAARGG